MCKRRGKVHKIDLRLRNNAGTDYPVCLAGEELLRNASGFSLTNDIQKTTCKRCLAAWKRRYPWAEQPAKSS